MIISEIGMSPGKSIQALPSREIAYKDVVIAFTNTATNGNTIQ